MLVRALWFGVSMACAPLLLSCSGGMQTPESVLEEQLREFQSHLRWGRFQEAASYVAPSLRQTFLGTYAELGSDFEVTEVELRAVSLDRGSDTAVVTTWMQWFRLPATTVRDETYTELWEYDAEARRWLLVERTEVE